MTTRRSGPSYANVASTLALIVALGTGGAYAAAQIGPGEIKPDAVRSKHVKKQAVKASDLAMGAVRGPRIAAGAVGSSKLADGAVVSSTVGETIIRSEMKTIEAGSFNTTTMSCAADETLLSGGGDVPGASTVTSIVESHPGFEMTPVWTVRARNTGGVQSSFTTWVLCLS